MSTIFGGGSGSSDTSSTPNMDDASLGDAITGGDGSFGATGGSDLGTMLSSIGQAFAGGGQTSVANSPAATVQAITQATDPTGSIGAQTAIAGGQGAPQQTQNQNPQGPTDNPSDTTQDQFAPTSAVDQLRKALTGLRQQQRQNPYSFPANSPQSNAAAGQNSPMLNRAASIPTDQTNQNPNAPSQDASNMEFMNDNNAPPPSGIDPADAVRAGLRSNAPDTSGQFKVPPAGNENAASEDFPAYLKGLRGGGGGAPPVPPQTDSSAPPTLDLGAQADGGGLGGLAAIARMMGLGPAATGAAIAMNPTPAETGEAPTNLPMQRPSGVQGPPDPADLPKSEVLREGEGGAATTTAPVTGKKVETVDPKTKKPVDPKTGDPLPTHTGPLPTHKGPQETSTGMDQEVGPIMRDVSGVSHGVPQGLGQIARMAMPLLMMAMSGGFGGGRRGGHWRGGGGFHPGGRGMWPYHHPTFGWGMHGFHPGGGWRPMHPVHFRNMGPTGDGGGMNPLMMSALLGGGGGNQQRGGPQQGQGPGQDQTQTQDNGDQQFGGDAVKPAPPATVEQAKGDMSYLQSLGLPQAGAAALLGNGWQESGLNPTGPAGDGGISRGMFQWDPNRYAAMRMWAQEQGLNPNDRKTQLGYAAHEIQQYYPNLWRQLQQGGDVGQLTKAIFSVFERGDPSKANMANRMKFAQSMAGGGADVVGKTSTGGSKAPNPDGNPVTQQQGPEGMAVAAQ